MNTKIQGTHILKVLNLKIYPVVTNFWAEQLGQKSVCLKYCVQGDLLKTYTFKPLFIHSRHQSDTDKAPSDQLPDTLETPSKQPPHIL